MRIAIGKYFLKKEISNLRNSLLLALLELEKSPVMDEIFVKN